MNITRVLALLPLFVVLAHSFSWDIVVAEEKRLNFYDDGTLTHTEDIPSAYNITTLTFDPVHDRVLFVDYRNSNMSILSSFDISTRNIQILLTRLTSNLHKSVAYDPVTQLLFWAEGKEIYSYSLKSASCNTAVEGKLLFTLNFFFWALAVDSCGGYIYWMTGTALERARFNGSEREVLIQGFDMFPENLAIDQQRQKIYWTKTITRNLNSFQKTIESADLNGMNRKTYYTIKYLTFPSAFAVSKDFIYWVRNNHNEIWQLPKYGDEEAKLFLNSRRYCWGCQFLAINYGIEELTNGNPNCKELISLISNSSHPIYEDVSLLCVHGTKVSGETRCECAQGYTGERCDVSLCHNYCLQGDCSVSAEGHPKCSCKAGYSGERCEVYACHKHCLNGGVCSVDAEGQPKCRCSESYTGERCEVDACHGYCSNNGICFLNEKNEPTCLCTADFDGKRCDAAITYTGGCVCEDNRKQQFLQNLYRVKQVINEELQRNLQFYSDFENTSRCHVVPVPVEVQG